MMFMHFGSKDRKYVFSFVTVSGEVVKTVVYCIQYRAGVASSRPRETVSCRY